MNQIENAVSCFKQGFSCSQAILSTFGEQFGLDREHRLEIGCWFRRRDGTHGGNLRCRHRGVYGLGIEIRCRFAR